MPLASIHHFCCPAGMMSSMTNIIATMDCRKPNVVVRFSHRYFNTAIVRSKVADARILRPVAPSSRGVLGVLGVRGAPRRLRRGRHAILDRAHQLLEGQGAGLAGLI